MRNPTATRIAIEDVKPGDVLLGSSQSKLDGLGVVIKAATKSEYVHAGICVANGQVAESVKKFGVKKSYIEDFVARYDYVVVLRQPDAWSQDRIVALNSFVDSLIDNQATYNLLGALVLIPNKGRYERELMERVRAYCTDPSRIPSLHESSFFCSELVAACFFAVGFLHPNLLAIYDPSAMSPGALARDYSFGTFLGYLSATEVLSIPQTDDLRNEPTFGEIFGGIYEGNDG